MTGKEVAINLPEGLIFVSNNTYAANRSANPASKDIPDGAETRLVWTLHVKK